MAMQTSPSSEVNDNNGLGIKMEGSLGDLQIIEESDSDDDKSCDEQESRTIDTSIIHENILQPTNAPVFGTVTVTSSENVHFGNNTYYNGPVTLQIIHDKGVENASYKKTDDEKYESPPQSDQNQKPTSDMTVKKFQIQAWHKLTIVAVCVIAIGGICAIVFPIQKTIHDVNDYNDISDGDLSPNCPKVEGFTYDNYKIIVSLILIPLTLLLMFYSLLTKKTSGGLQLVVHMNKKDEVKINDSNDDLCIYTAKADKLLIAPEHLRIVPRSDWLAQPVENKLDSIVQPVPWVIIAHTATESCDSQSICVLRVRIIQSFHIESKGWYDIGYNFLVGGDGSAYYGRGWDYIGAHTKGYNKYSIGIAFIGTFTKEAPPKQQIDACKKLIRLGVQKGKIAKDYKLFVHRQLMSTQSPGDKLVDIIKEWPHYVNTTNISELLPNY